MALIDQLYSASYKGAPFLVLDEGTEGGQKTVIKEFINSNIQSIEELGRKPRTYTMTAVIREPFYIAKRDRLLLALEQGGGGVLIHPFYGRLENMKLAAPYRLTQDTRSLGEARFNLVFAASDTDGLPTQATNTVSLLAQLASTVFSDVSSDISTLFNVTSTFTGNFDAAVSKVENIVTAFEVNSRALATIPDKINDFSSLLGNLADNVNSIVQNPSELASSLDELFTEFPSLYESPTDQTDALSLFFDFGDDDIFINQTTAGLIERAQNNDVLNAAVKTYSLAQSYVSSAQIDFTTVSEINNTASRLEDNFKSIKSLVGLG